MKEGFRKVALEEAASERLQRRTFEATPPVQGRSGRRDRTAFAVDIPGWIASGREADPDLLMPDEPKFLRTDVQMMSA